MSRSNSTGDLVPRDITEVLAQQNRANKGKKKQGSSLGRAFSWLKGTKRKRSISNGLGGGAGGLGGGAAGLGGGAGDDRTSKPGHVNQEPSRAGTKQDEQKKLSVHYTASQIYPENVFIEGSRPQYLEDLHTEAQEGLKILQQEEHKNNVDFRDDHTVSTDATQTERDDLSRETDGSVASSSTAGSSVASVPTVCSRPVLTRQGSTFKPLNPVKRLDKTRRRSRRTTIMGIPQQVQMELGMGRGALAQQLPNGEGSVSNGIVIIPTVDGEKPVMNHEGARVHLQDIEAFQASREEHLLRQHIHRVYRDDLALNRKVGPRPSPNQRPKSLAVPGMTSSSLLQEPQGPVMSISPQATYLSKIIPNAILPAAVDVIKIDRSRSRSSVRSSVRTVSKSSLPPASPASSRSEGSSMDEPASSGSNWSQSQSSETIVSNSSTISSKRSGQTSSAGVRHLKTGDQVSIQSSSSWLSSDKADDKGMQSRCVSAGEGSDSGNCVRNSYIFSRSLSITKTKLPPAPPRRTYSLHHEKLKRRSRELMDIKDSCDLGPNRTQIGTDPGNSMPEAISSNRVKTPTKSTVSSSQNNSQSSVTSGTSSPEQDSSGDQSVSSNSSPQKVTLDKSAFDRTLSPSSGYSSQSGTPTLSHKVIYPPSPGKQRAKPPKPERTGSRTSSAISVSSSTSSISSPQSEPVHRDTQPKDTPSHPTKTPPSVKTENNKESSPPSTIILKELSNIPPPPKVKAPSPPPPETWAHNKRTFELLCGPGPNITRMNQLLKAQQKEVLLINTESDSSAKQTVHCLSESEAVASERNEPLSIQAHEHTTELERETLALGHKESSVSHKKDTESLLIKKEEALMSQGQAERLTNLGVDQDTHAMAEKSHINMPQNTQTEADDTSLVVLKSSHMETENGNKEDAIEHVGKSLENDQQLCSHLYVKACKDSSPPPSPPPAHHPPPPPKKSPTTSVSTTACEEEETFIMESSWPPPPPPMEDSSDLVFEGQEEVDFPPPPPLLMQDSPFKPGETCVKCEGHADVTLRRSSESPEVSHGMTDGVESKGHLTTVPDEENLTDQLSNIPEVLQTEPRPLSDENLSDNVANRAQTTGPAPAHSRPSPESQAVQHVPAKPSTPPQIAPKPPTIMTTNEYNHQMPRGTLAQVPLAPPPPLEDQSTINFKRTTSLSSKESKSKDLLSRNKCIPIPKEDANIPLVTPSLLQMVRLRSVSVGEDPGKVPQAGKSCPEGPTSQEQTLSHATPQKPVRKSLCLKSTPPQTLTSPPATTPAPSMCLQEAIRMKTAAMSSRDRHPTRPSLSMSQNNSTEFCFTQKTTEGSDLLKSPASTASFIFSKSTKKVVIETPTSPEAQAGLKQSLAAELMQVSEQTKCMAANGTKKTVKMPPPVAKKPAHGTNYLYKSGTATTPKAETSLKEQVSSVPKTEQANGGRANVQPAGQQAHQIHTEEAESGTEIANSIEVS